MNIASKLKNALLLCAILAAGLFLRSYNLDFPSIGYHNMTENEYLSIAHEMASSGDYAARKVYFNDAFGDKSAKEPRFNFPLVSYQTIAAWRIFGENVWGPRLFNVAFGLLSVLLIYMIAGILFNKKAAALGAAAAMAIMPLGVFFSRNLQSDSPALFFMLLGTFFYLKYERLRRSRDLVLGGFSFSAAFLYKAPFIIGLLPLIPCLVMSVPPAGKKKKPSAQIISLLFPYLVTAAIIFMAYRSAYISMHSPEWPGPLEVFKFSYWKEHGTTIWTHIRSENFTIVYAASSIIGILIALFRRRDLLERYIAGWAIAIIPYAVFYSDKLYQNNFSQMPFLALVSIASTYAAVSVAGWLERFIRIDLAGILLLALTVLAAPVAYDSVMRMHSTVFLGVDVAGESLKNFTKPDERVFLYTHAQGYGIARYARRYTGWASGIEDFKDKQDKFKIRYICVYPSEFIYDLQQKDPPLYEYIRRNYHIKEAGMTEKPRHVFYLILEKGEIPDGEDFSRPLSGRPQLKTIYRISSRYVFFYVLCPEAPAAQRKAR